MRPGVPSPVPRPRNATPPPPPRRTAGGERGSRVALPCRVTVLEASGVEKKRRERRFLCEGESVKKLKNSRKKNKNTHLTGTTCE